MRRILVALTLVAASTFLAAPVAATEGAEDSTESAASAEPSESQAEEEQPPAEDPPPADPPSAEDQPPPTPVVEPPTQNESSSGIDGQSSGSGDSTSGSGGQTPGASGPSKSTELASAGQIEEVTDVGPVDGSMVRVCSADGTGTYTLSTVSALDVVDGNGIGDDDIIEPFSYDGGSYPGKNWDTGKSIYTNDCTAPIEASAPGGGATSEGGFETLAAGDKVTICHARGQGAIGNVYGPQAITVNANSIFNPNNGHDTHNGPVYFTGIAEQWGDIIPPFAHDGGFYPGQNWNDAGQAFFFNDCQEPDDENPPPPGEEKVTICHADSNPQQPYGPGAISVSVNSILNLNGHASHNAPEFVEGAENWGDIIPPFVHENGSFPGLNWDGDGQAIFFNDCQIPEDEEECPEDSEDEECEEDDDDEGKDDDDEGKDDDDEGKGDDGDKPRSAALLPDTGGSSLWSLLMGLLLTVLGLTVLTNRESMAAIFGRGAAK